jgi:hypothetical protein
VTAGVDIAFVVVGLALIGFSRVFAEAFTVRGDRSATTRFLGLGDDYASRFLRWATAVLVGLAFVAAGVADLFG